MNSFNGTPVRSSPLALTYHTKFIVVKARIAKRRKRYRVRRKDWSEPGCYQLADGTLVMHPALIEKMQAARLQHGSEKK